MFALNTPFRQAVAILVGAYVLIDFGIPYIPPLLGMASAPVPNTVVIQYLITIAVGILLWLSDNEERWREFKKPIHEVLVRPDKRIARGALLVVVPFLVAFLTFNRVKPDVSAPPSFRAIHPAPPSTITFRGEVMELTGLENPLRSQGSLEEHYQEGMRVYHQNCMACHGDALDGRGYYGEAFNPAPLNFRDVGTIAQLTESYVFWRIAKGGPGLPNEGSPWNSAMPAWETFLTAEETWAVIIFLYEQTGHSPRTWEEEHE
ncbi:MAG TPA: cytochrome c [Longimicrobiaceae bacterium]|nr:cytochrome c [Longimicrobiaceae bacterium]